MVLVPVPEVAVELLLLAPLLSPNGAGVGAGAGAGVGAGAGAEAVALVVGAVSKPLLAEAIALLEVPPGADAV
jgi:hypothetical protein